MFAFKKALITEAMRLDRGEVVVVAESKSEDALLERVNEGDAPLSRECKGAEALE